MSYIKSLGSEKSMDILGKLVLKCVDLGGPLTKEVAQLALERRFAELVAYEIDYEKPYTVDDLIYARQVLAFYSKYEQLDLGVDKEQVALNRFIEAEDLCLETNRRLSSTPPKGRVAVVEHYAARKISKVLGVLPDLGKFEFQFGPGATTSAKASVANPRVKLSARLECSHNLAPSVGAFLSEVPLLTAHHSASGICTFNSTCGYEVVDVVAVPGVLMFVPKNARTYRSIVVEPHLNGLFQKGVGSYMKERMRLHGLDLSDQEANQTLAQRGSLTGLLATIDLKMASDTLARETPFRLLPLDWASFLYQLTTRKVVYRETVLFGLEKFSSMGNGFTFELESLIFWALADGCCRALELRGYEVRSYGDDIIIPVKAVALLKEVLEYYGFLVNTEKSYDSGPFRESCGADYVFGIDIRPFYVKEHLSYRSLFTMHNWFVRHCEWELASLVESLIPKHLALYGPDGFGDGHLLGSYTLRRNRRMKRDQWCGGYFDTYSLKPQTLKKSMRLLPGDWVYPAYSVYTRSGASSPTDPNVVRGSKGYAKVSIYTLATGVFR